MKNFAESNAYSNMDLLNKLLDCKLNTDEFLNNEKVITEITKIVDVVSKKSEGYVLTSITNNKKTNLLLIVLDGKESYNIYSWEIDEAFDKKLDVVIHEQNFKKKFDDFIIDSRNKSRLTTKEILYSCVIESLTGYNVNTTKIEEFVEFRKQDGKTTRMSKENFADSKTKNIAQAYRIGDSMFKNIAKARKKTSTALNNYVGKLKCNELNIKLAQRGLGTGNLFIGKIDEVRRQGNTRHYKVNWINWEPTKATFATGTSIGRVTPSNTGNTMSVNKLGEIYVAHTSQYSYYGSSFTRTFDVDYAQRIPYNYVDEGRILLGVQREGNRWDVIISGDPKVDENYEQTMLDVLDRYADHIMSKEMDLSGTNIKQGKTTYQYEPYEYQVSRDNRGLQPLQLKMKSLKKMVDEYNYLVKKKKSEGGDIFITDKVKYNHTTGTVSYNNFSIGMNEEFVKSKLHESFNRYLVAYYRNEITEEDILNSLIDTVFKALKSRLDAHASSPYELNIKVNDNINVKLEIKISKSYARMIYLNGIKFNKNEVLTVLKEITCYQKQEEADMFINNIGKLGLSVYIGITTGYEAEIYGSKRIFRFKKEKGRAKYKLVLDTIEIPIKGKKLISNLYSRFIGEPVNKFSNKVNKIMFECTESSLDYLKYKFLIDATYEAFKKKSKEFLDKKVSDNEGEYVNYKNKKSGKILDAISITGMSGNQYVIAYDSKNSYVFMNPEVDEDKIYKEGKYICMIDQSNIKSNIGYDTVVSKLMALKNDSIIAGTIYNLEEELS